MPGARGRYCRVSGGIVVEHLVLELVVAVLEICKNKTKQNKKSRFSNICHTGEISDTPHGDNIAKIEIVSTANDSISHRICILYQIVSICSSSLPFLILTSAWAAEEVWRRGRPRLFFFLGGSSTGLTELEISDISVVGGDCCNSTLVMV